ncbi:MAG: hypothetical protein WCC27_07360, partial [Acidobacteriaceae bacterium]
MAYAQATKTKKKKASVLNHAAQARQRADVDEAIARLSFGAILRPSTPQEISRELRALARPLGDDRPGAELHHR